MTRTVVHFTDTTGFGGAEQMMLITLAGLDRSRWRPVVMHYPNAGGRELAAAAAAIGVDSRVVPGTTGLRGVAELSEFANILRSEDTALLHAHLVGPLRCTKGFIAARVARVPGIVATQHLYAELPSSRDRVRQSFAAAQVDRYIAVSEGMARDLRRYIPSRDKVVVIHNAIDPAAFAPMDGSSIRRNLGIADGRPTVLAVARLHERKGISYLLSAIAGLPEVVLIVAGDGPERVRLESLAVDLGIAERVHFLGTRSDIPRLLHACDLFALPSLTEGLPVSVIEAMAAGKPVVATDIPGTNEIVVHGETGLLVPPCDSDALGAAIGSILRDSGARERMGEAGRRRVDESFSVDGMIARIERVYEEVLSLDGLTEKASTAIGFVGIGSAEASTESTGESP